MLKYVGNLVLVLLFCSVILEASDFPQWRGVNRDGNVQEGNLAESWPAAGPEQLWAANDIGSGYSSPIEVAGKTYITGMKASKATLTALDSVSGKQFWQVQFGLSWDQKQYGGERSTPTYDQGKLYLFNPHGQLYCLNASDGEQIWMVDTQKEYGARNITWGITESVVVEGDMVICSPGGENIGLVAFNKNDGKMIWKTHGLGESAYCSPTVVGHSGIRMLITIMSESICGIDVSDGTVLWQVEHNAPYSINAVTPIYEDGIFYISNGYNMGGRAFEIAADGKSAKEIWQDKRLDCQLGGISLMDGKVFGIGQNGSIVVLDLKTGKVVSTSQKYCGKGALLIADNMIYCYGESSKVALVKYSEGTFSLGGTFSIKLGEKEHWAHPVVSNGKLYIRHGDYLMAFDIAKK